MECEGLARETKGQVHTLTGVGIPWSLEGHCGTLQCDLIFYTVYSIVQFKVFVSFQGLSMYSGLSFLCTTIVFVIIKYELHFNIKDMM